MLFEEDPAESEKDESKASKEKFEINWETVWERDKTEREEELFAKQQEEIASLEAERALLEAERLRLAKERTLAQQSKKELEKAELERAKERYRKELQRRHILERKQEQPASHSAAIPKAMYSEPLRSNMETAKAAYKQEAEEPTRSVKGQPKPHKRKHRKFKVIFVTAAALATLYCVAVFSNIPLIEKWRTIYIETAMSTLSHHWLATAFIPKGVIDKVVSEGNVDILQEGMSSNWSIGGLPIGDVSRPWVKAEKKFFKVFNEIESDSFADYLEKSGDDIFDDDGYLMIDQSGLNQKGTSVKTTVGDQVLAIDTKNGISVIRVTGEGYVGKLAIIKDPSQVGLGLSPGFDSEGAVLGDIARKYGAVLGINASGFADPAGHGDGSNAYGMVIAGGEVYKKPVGGSYKMIAFDQGHKLNIGEFSGTKDFRDGVEFKPALVLNGEKVVSGSAGWGIAPRSIIGQTKDGQVLLLIIDGRAPGYSIGNTMEECADIMLRYGAMQACNLDGGSSSLMFYNGREITKPSSANKEIGRRIPNGFMVSGRK